MIIRKVKDSEQHATGELFSIAFEFTNKFEKTNDEDVLAMQEHPNSRFDLYYREKWAAFDDDDQMTAYIGTLPYPTQFDGNVVPMTGIGGVSSLPHCRKGGAIRGCFTHSLRDAYDTGVTLSYLFPFSTAYYNKFGYEVCGSVQSLKLDLRALKTFPQVQGRVFLHKKGSQTAAIRKVYEDFSKSYNFCIAREDIDYLHYEKSDPAADGFYIYVFYNDQGEAKGVMAFQKVKEDDHFNMQCRIFQYSDLEGLKGLLNHVQAFAAYYEFLCIEMPMDFNPAIMVKDWAQYPYTRSIRHMGMGRVVNVKRALELAAYRGSGEVFLCVDDAILPQNSHTFHVTFHDGKATEVAVADQAAPDISLPVADFSRMLLGDLPFAQTAFLERVQIHKNEEMLAKVFYQKPLFICDYF